MDLLSMWIRSFLGYVPTPLMPGRLAANVLTAILLAPGTRMSAALQDACIEPRARGRWADTTRTSLLKCAEIECIALLISGGRHCERTYGQASLTSAVAGVAANAAASIAAAISFFITALFSGPLLAAGASRYGIRAGCASPG